MTGKLKTILFLYEGDTEKEFYKLFFSTLPQRKIKISWGNLEGVWDLNGKVKSKINTFLLHSNYKEINKIHLFVAFDREGDRSVKSALDIESLKKEFIQKKKNRIVSINEIVATQDLESLFFHDLNGIYNFLNIPKKKRNLKAFPNIEATNNRVLSDLFHKNGKHYQKGSRVVGFLNSLNIETIISKTKELVEAQDEIKKIMK